jgi:hypothetical protein
VDYSRPQPSPVDWTESYPSEGAEERMRSRAVSGYADRLMRLLAYSVLTAAFSSYFLYDWRAGGGDGPLVLGLAFLAFFAFCAAMLYGMLREAYSEPDTGENVPSHEDAETMHYEATGLPPRR